MTTYSTHYLEDPSKIMVEPTIGNSPILMSICSSAGGLQVYMTPEQLIILAAEIQKALDKTTNIQTPTRDGSQRETPSDHPSTVNNYAEVVKRHKGADHYDTISNLAARVYQLESTIQRWVKNQE